MFIVVRHGNTFETGETPRRIGARTDLPLTTHGIEQAQALGRHFAGQGWRFARALVSPLLRTRQTAELILAAQEGAPPSPEPADFLCEIDHGPDENATEPEVVGRIGDEALAAWDNRAVPPQGWTVEAGPRIAAWRELFAGVDTAEGPVLLVTSNGAGRFALLADPALEAAVAELPSLKLPTGGYGIIARRSDGSLWVPVWGARP